MTDNNMTITANFFKRAAKRRKVALDNPKPTTPKKAKQTRNRESIPHAMKIERRRQNYYLNTIKDLAERRKARQALRAGT